jgi:large subunit ribosomal protein L11
MLCLLGLIDYQVFNVKHILFISEFSVPNFKLSTILICCVGVEKGSKDPKLQKVGKVTIDQLRTIATEKLPDLNCSTIDSAMRIIAGTAANMGIDVDPPILAPKEKQLL